MPTANLLDAWAFGYTGGTSKWSFMAGMATDHLLLGEVYFVRIEINLTLLIVGLGRVF